MHCSTIKFNLTTNNFFQPHWLQPKGVGQFKDC
jgi:hypothetical protein